MTNITHEGIVTVACSWTFALLALLSLSAIHWNRLYLKKGMHLEDYLLLFSFACSVGLTSVMTWAIFREGLYQHLDNVSYSEAELMARVSG